VNLQLTAIAAEETGSSQPIISPAGMQSLTSLLAATYRAHASKGLPAPAAASLREGRPDFDVFAACVLCTYLQLARRILLLIVTRLDRPAGSAPPTLTRSRRSRAATANSAADDIGPTHASMSGTNLPQRCASGTIRHFRPRFEPTAPADLHVNWYKELRGQMGCKLGSGAFGQVYKASWRGVDVAVKLFHSGPDTGVNSSMQMVSFRAETKIMAELSKECERIVRMYGACLTPPHMCIIYEYVGGGALHELIHDLSKPLPYLQVLRIGRDIAEGLAFMHPAIVHRDLKPHNILLTEDGRAKICDLGLGRTKDPLKSYLITEAGGTPYYMAPEIFTDCKSHDTADMYALGVIMNEMMARKPPWAYDTPFQVIYAVSVRKERPAMSVWCPPALAKLIRRCWAEDVKTRPSAREVVAELGGLIAAAEAQTPPEGAAPIQLTV